MTGREAPHEGPTEPDALAGRQPGREEYGPGIDPGGSTLGAVLGQSVSVALSMHGS